MSNINLYSNLKKYIYKISEYNIKKSQLRVFHYTKSYRRNNETDTRIEKFQFSPTIQNHKTRSHSGIFILHSQEKGNRNRQKENSTFFSSSTRERMASSAQRQKSTRIINC